MDTTSQSGPPSYPLRHPSSYRDPSGFIFTFKEEVYRQVNASFQKDFKAFISSGLYQKLTTEKLLIIHEIINENITGDATWFTTIKPEQLSFISYPYEWSFSMLKDAALLTLTLALEALEHGMMLKDASPYNVQLHNGRMTFIDTLSFELYEEGSPWIAYRQFCENFIGPLALMHYHKLPMQQLLLAHPEGVPLAYAKELLPYRSRFNLLLYLHIHLHASYASKPSNGAKKTFLPKAKLINLLKGMQSLVTSFMFEGYQNVWGGYYEEAATRSGYLEEKKEIVSNWLSATQGINTVIDVGGNKGEFTLITRASRVICADGEHHAVDALYKYVKKESLQTIIPLCIDFTAPSPAIGVNNEERDSFLTRATSDLAMALALIHHLSIGKNIPFQQSARMFAQLGRFLIIEFVPKEDEKVQLLLQHKKDIYDWYTEESFVTSFSSHFNVLEKRSLSSSLRTIYLMERL